MLLQLNPSFNIQALEALVTLKAVDATVAEVEAEVAICQEGMTIEGVASEGAIEVVITEETSGATIADTEAAVIGAVPEGQAH